MQLTHRPFGSRNTVAPLLGGRLARALTVNSEIEQISPKNKFAINGVVRNVAIIWGSSSFWILTVNEWALPTEEGMIVWGVSSRISASHVFPVSPAQLGT
jgi:hypothetical protein